MHPEHRALLEELKAAGRPADPRFDAARYFGAERRMLNVTVPARRAIASAWAKAHKAAAPAEVAAVVDSLVAGASHEEKTLGPLLLAYLPRQRRRLGPAEVDRWLGRLSGWAEIDTLCQNLFTAAEVLADWPAWSTLIRDLAGDANVNRRRAALVLLTGPAARSADARLADLAFETIERLKGERDILITKAVSWLLRSLTAQHPARVARYLDAEAASLPAIAVRETRTKLATGRKTARPTKGS